MTEHTPKTTTKPVAPAASPAPKPNLEVANSAAKGAVLSRPEAAKESGIAKIEKQLAKAKESNSTAEILKLELELINAKSKERKSHTKDPDLLRAIELEEKVSVIHAKRKAKYIEESNKLAKEKTILGTVFGWIGLETRNAVGVGKDMTSEAAMRTYHGILAGLHGAIKGMKESAISAKDKLMSESKLAKGAL